MPPTIRALPVGLSKPCIPRGTTVGRPSNEPDRLGSRSALALRPCTVPRAIHATVIAHEAGIVIAPMITRSSATALLPTTSRWCSRHPSNAIQYPAMLSKGIGRKRSKNARRERLEPEWQQSCKKARVKAPRKTQEPKASHQGPARVCAGTGQSKASQGQRRPGKSTDRPLRQQAHTQAKPRQQAPLA